MHGNYSEPRNVPLAPLLHWLRLIWTLELSGKLFGNKIIVFKILFVLRFSLCQFDIIAGTDLVRLSSRLVVLRIDCIHWTLLDFARVAQSAEKVVRLIYDTSTDGTCRYYI